MAVTVGMARASANAAELCGDMAQSWALKDRTVLAIADGLGHGKYAAEAAVKAMDYIGKHLDGAPDRLFSGLQRDLRLTRGAAVAVAVIDPGAGRLTYAAIGNTRAAIFGWRQTRLDATPGVVGGGFRKVQLHVQPMRAGDVLVLWTDGLEERLTLAGVETLEGGGVGRKSVAPLS